MVTSLSSILINANVLDTNGSIFIPKPEHTPYGEGLLFGVSAAAKRSLSYALTHLPQNELLQLTDFYKIPLPNSQSFQTLGDLAQKITLSIIMEAHELETATIEKNQSQQLLFDYFIDLLAKQIESSKRPSNEELHKYDVTNYTKKIKEITMLTQSYDKIFYAYTDSFTDVAPSDIVNSPEGRHIALKALQIYPFIKNLRLS